MRLAETHPEDNSKPSGASIETQPVMQQQQEVRLEKDDDKDWLSLDKMDLARRSSYPCLKLEPYYGIFPPISGFCIIRTRHACCYPAAQA
jgi:hypothetical protein